MKDESRLMRYPQRIQGGKHCAEDSVEPGFERRFVHVARVSSRQCRETALAWLMALKPWIVPIPGTTQMPLMLENIGADAVKLSREEFAELNRQLSAIKVHGARLPDAVLQFSGVEAPEKA